MELRVLSLPYYLLGGLKGAVNYVTVSSALIEKFMVRIGCLFKVRQSTSVSGCVRWSVGRLVGWLVDR